ncbi:hypothetical protein Y032_0061g3203 [Ancylostoma ceylanicum]|uniref:Uncharacterized protein n=1 Tax=Ancylostoma ceylanicum TaxID=53326 RepID=A0A016U3L1_9BILA|nr:hypothetical protein Y032_0061g3203 [Ancylostoma ceylanicum]
MRRPASRSTRFSRFVGPGETALTKLYFDDCAAGAAMLRGMAQNCEQNLAHKVGRKQTEKRVKVVCGR